MQELVYEGRREPFANLKDLHNVMAWCGWSDSEKSYLAMEKNVYQQWISRIEGLFSTFSANQLTDDYCDVLV